MGTKTYKAGRLFESDDAFTIGEILIGGWDGALPFSLTHVTDGEFGRIVQGTYLDEDGKVSSKGPKCRFLTDNDGDEGICRAI